MSANENQGGPFEATDGGQSWTTATTRPTEVVALAPDGVTRRDLRGRRRSVFLALLAGVMSACATGARPPGGPERAQMSGPTTGTTPPPETPRSRPRPAPPSDLDAGASAPSAPNRPVVAPPVAVPPPPATTGTSPLAWVNPARCLSSCAFDPADALRRVNDQGEVDPKGRHRVDGAALAALRELLAAARAAGHLVRISSAYRSYDEQARVFRTTREKGRAARPGHSEHQLGTAVDLRLPTTRAIDWLAAHAAAYGFVLSYPPGKQRITGYRPEPWHVRFVGLAIAAEVPAGESLEELFRRRPDLAESGSCADCPAAASRKACGRVTTEGACEGTVLSWCFDGALATVDCATFKHTCPASAGAIPDCVPMAGHPGDGPGPEDASQP